MQANRKYRSDKVYKICFDVQLDGGDVDFINSVYERVTTSMLINDKNIEMRNKFFNALIKLEEIEFLIQEVPNFDSFNLKTISGICGLLEALCDTELYVTGILDVETSSMYAENLRNSGYYDNY